MAFLKSIFGPSREEIWRQLCDDVGGQYVDGGFWKGDQVQLSHGEWTITLDTFTVSTGERSKTLTRLRAPYVNPDGFRFSVYRKGVFSELGKRLGMQDVEIGVPGFDDDFIVKGNNEEKLKQLFTNHRIRELIELLPNVQFKVADDDQWFAKEHPEGVDCLYFHSFGVLRDLERLKVLYWLFAETLDHLCDIGSAYQNRPNVTL